MMKKMEEQKTIADELTKILSLHTATLEATADGILVVDSNGCVVSHNKKFLRLWNIPDTLIATHDDNQLLEYVLDQLEDPEGFLREVRRLYSCPEEHSHDFLKFKDGRLFERISYPQKVEDNIIGRVWSFRDITERKKAEAKLWESQEYYRALVENSDLGITIMDTNHKIIMTNTTFCKLFKKPAHYFVGKNCYKEYEKRDAVCPHCPGVGAMATGKATEVETQAVLDDGTCIYVRNRAVPFFGPDGVVMGFIEMVENIDARKRAELKLCEAEEKYRIQFEGALDAIFVADAETGILIDCNPAGTRLVGREKSELIGQSHKILHPQDKNEGEFNEIFERHLKEKQGQTLETQVITKTGEIREVAIKANLLEIRGKKVLQGIFRDITEHKRAQKELKKIHEELLITSRKAGMAEVATDVLHNIGNVLNSINVSMSVIKEKVLNSKVANLRKIVDMLSEHADDLGTFLTEDPRGKHIPVFLSEAAKLIVHEQTDITETLRSLTNNVEHIKQIIKAQQGYARVGGVEVLTSINEVIKHAIEISRASLTRHDINLKLDLAELPNLHLDKQRVLEILINLINNSKHAMSESQKQEKLLTIRSYRHHEDRVRVDVADNGMGIAKENMTKIFQHGFTTKKDGHGFGLHSSALAAKQMGGSLSSQSDGLEQGALFTLELPLKSGIDIPDANESGHSTLENH